MVNLLYISRFPLIRGNRMNVHERRQRPAQDFTRSEGLADSYNSIQISPQSAKDMG